MGSVDVLVLGGGVGGIVAANELRPHLDEGDSITIVDESPEHEFKPSYMRVVTGEKETTDIGQSLTRFDDGPVSFFEAAVTAIDPEREVVETTEGTLEYDYLVVALGAALDPGAVPGFGDARAHHVYTARAAEAYRDALESFSGGEIAIGVSSLPYVCPSVPVEAALITDHFLRKRDRREGTTLKFFFPKEAPMKKAGENVAEMVLDRFDDRDIEYYGHHAMDAVDGDERTIQFENGETMTYDLLFATPPQKGPDVVASSPLADESGWIPVDHETLATEYDGVYAVGDNAKVVIPSIGKPLPKAGVFARGQATAVADQIVADVTGGEADERFDGTGECFLVTRYGPEGAGNRVEVDFFAEGGPEAEIPEPRRSQRWYQGKVQYEQDWYREWIPAGEG